MNHIIETPRLFLREVTVSDLDFLATMMADPKVMRFYPKRYSREEVEAWIGRQQESYSKHGHGNWLVLDKATGEPVGRAGLTMQAVDRVEQPELGYMIHRPFWRQGLATEAAIAVRDYAFWKLNKPYVISLIRPENLPSQGVARKLGMAPRDQLVTHAGLPHQVFWLCREC
jgi:[ribosomal protein S5]-alanine N-acetyltransferase